MNEQQPLVLNQKPTAKAKVHNIFSPQIQIFEPFGAHVDPSRTNMSSKQILQLITSRMNDSPFIFNKAYRDFTEIKSPYFLRARSDGVILCNEFNILFIVYHDTNDMAFEYIPPVKKIQSHALNLRYIRPVGNFNAGDLLFDYTGQTELGVPKVGYRTKVLFGSFLGYTAEDAMVISETYSKRAQVDYFEKLYIPITKKIKYIKNQNNNYFYKLGESQHKNFLTYLKIDTTLNLDSQLVNATEENSRYYVKYLEGLEGAEIKEVKIHRINKTPFNEIAKEYIYSPDLIKEVAELYNEKYIEYTKMVEKYKSLSFRDINMNDLVNQIFTSFFTTPKPPARLLNEVAEKFGIMDKDIDYLLEIDICQTVPTVLGDKFANCFAGKGTISMIIPDHLMPINEKGEPVDLIFNPLGIYGRNNWGCIFELGMAKVILNVEETLEDKDLTKDKITMINELFIKVTDLDYYERVNYLLDNFDQYFEYFKDDIIRNKFYINVDNFPEMPYEKFYNEFIEPYSNAFNIIVNKQKYIFKKELAEWITETRGYTLVGLSEHKDVETEAFFGDAYYLKLFHTSNSKYNSVAIARKYNKANGQPAKGRKKNGGQHISWMTLAADLGHADNSSITKELSTIKSDCITNKEQFICDKIYTGQYGMKTSGYDSKTNEMINHHLAAMFGMKFVYAGEAVETSRATEHERVLNRIKENEMITNFTEFEKREETIFNDFELNDLNLENIVVVEEEDYFNNII